MEIIFFFIIFLQCLLIDKIHSFLIYSFYFFGKKINLIYLVFGNNIHLLISKRIYYKYNSIKQKLNAFHFYFKYIKKIKNNL